MRRTIACVVGTRPEAVKMAPVIHRLRRDGGEVACRVLATGQHQELLHRTLADLGIEADRILDALPPGQSLADMTALMLRAVSTLLAEERPDLVLSVGDTTTVFAAALASFYQRIPFGHVEAGLRTGRPDRPFPEEKNREMAARLATLHFAPTSAARANLLREGIDPDAVIVTGNTVIDALFSTFREARALPIHPPGARFLLVTVHRRENWGEPMRRIAAALRDLVRGDPSLGLLIPAHPNPEVRRPLEDALGDEPRAVVREPMGYRDFVAAMSASAAIVTDSGGVQEEGTALGKSVFVLRPETERPEVVASGRALLVGTERQAIVAAVEAFLRAPSPIAPAASPLGDGRAADRIARAIAGRFGWDLGPGDEGIPPWPPAD